MNITISDEVRKVEKKEHFCLKCRAKTTHLVVDTREILCWAICQVCSTGRYCWGRGNGRN